MILVAMVATDVVEVDIGGGWGGGGVDRAVLAVVMA